MGGKIGDDDASRHCHLENGFRGDYLRRDALAGAGKKWRKIDLTFEKSLEQCKKNPGTLAS
jgi:hypothetical protein